MRRPPRPKPGSAERTLWKWLAWALVHVFFVHHCAQSQATYASEFQLAWCTGGHCVDSTISAAHFQLRIHRYYEQDGRPPLREAFFLATLPVPYQRELLNACPGVMVLAFLLVAEVRLYTHPLEEAEALLVRAEALMSLPEIVGPHLVGIQQAWPLDQALAKYEATLLKLQEAPRGQMSLDIVLPRCHEDLAWLGNRAQLEMLPRRTRVFIYEKCGEDPDEVRVNLTERLEERVTVIRTVLHDAPDPWTGLPARRDECTAYLTHVVRYYHATLADVTLFLHGDPGDHTPMGLLNIVIRGLVYGTLHDLEFLHLGSPRMVHTSNPCQAGFFEAAVGRPLLRPLSTYCCSQFAVARRRLRARPHSDYVRLLRLVDGSTPDMCERIGPSYEKYRGQRLSHCFFLEFMWHVVFGEEEELPLRSDDSRLPPSVRFKDNEESTPSVWRSYLSKYVGGQAAFSAEPAGAWLSQIQQDSGLEDVRTQHNFGDLVHH